MSANISLSAVFEISIGTHQNATSHLFREDALVPLDLFRKGCLSIYLLYPWWATPAWRIRTVHQLYIRWLFLFWGTDNGQFQSPYILSGLVYQTVIYSIFSCRLSAQELYHLTISTCPRNISSVNSPYTGLSREPFENGSSKSRCLNVYLVGWKFTRVIWWPSGVWPGKRVVFIIRFFIPQDHETCLMCTHSSLIVFHFYENELRVHCLFVS